MNVYLIGFMAAGKSTVGPPLAARLNWNFIDSDEVVQADTGQSIQQIFAKEGETAFRKYETSALRRLSQFDHQVIAVGGGAPALQCNWTYLSQGLSVYLKMAAEDLLKRLAQTKRPLLRDLSGAQRCQRVRHLLEKRRPFYEQATLTVHATGTPASIARSIAERIQLCRS